ncbi:MAG: hypothetical protein OXG58_11425 [Gemmatimonadetes bacterium]|nr:hypothetical protein [Gemmatimonadota bacterium]MCY3943854.1 hypothetical protein [Gemmatimonadota bacterium]
MIVTPDASVLLKWVLPGDDEQDTDAALGLRDGVFVTADERCVRRASEAGGISSLRRWHPPPGREGA